MHRYTEEQKQFLRKNITGNSYKTLTELFNQKFDTDIKIKTITSMIGNMGLSNGLNTTFKKGKIPWNKGKSYQPGGRSIETRFKKGQQSLNRRPIGSERISKDGIVYLKTPEGKWKPKHQYVWEKNNGPIPKGHVVIFNNRNRRDFSKENLLLVSRKQLVILNKNGLLQNSKELNDSAVLIADLLLKMGELKK